MRKNDTCVIALIIFYKSKTENSIKVYKVYSIVLYFDIDNYVCIDNLCCHPKKVSNISSDKRFEKASYNILLFIGIPGVLMNLVSCHGFLEKSNFTLILNCSSCLVNYHLAKTIVIIKHNSKQLSSFLNEVKLRIHEIDKQKNRFC